MPMAKYLYKNPPKEGSKGNAVRQALHRGVKVTRVANVVETGEPWRFIVNHLI